MFRMKSDENGKEGLVPEEVLDTPGGGAAVLLAKASPGEPRFLLGKDTGGASWTMYLPRAICEHRVFQGFAGAFFAG